MWQAFRKERMEEMLSVSDVMRLIGKSESTCRRLMDRLGATRLTDESPRELPKSKLESYLAGRGIPVDWSVLGGGSTSVQQS